MADKINQIEIGGTTYDLQDKKSIFSGTAAEYEATADTIEDGTVVNITDDFVEGETLDAYVLNKVDELEDKLGSSIKTREELMANAEEDKLADALAIKEALNYYNVGRNSGASYASLEAFVEATATDTTIPHVGRFKDAGGFITGSVTWYRYIIVYQNPYITGGASSVRGNGIIWDDAGKMRNIFISGNKDTGLNLEYELVNKPTITTKDDLMANTVSGFSPDALAVKEGFQDIENSLVKYCADMPFVNDLLEEANKGNDSVFAVRFSQNTTNTPYTDGLSGSASSGVALICMSSLNYGQIIAFIAGSSRIFNRYKNNSGWSNWNEVTMTPQNINPQLVYSEKTTSTSGIIWKQGKTIIFQKCFKALSDMQHGDIICTLPYDCYWTYMSANYNDKAFNAVINDINGRNVLIDKMTIEKDGFFFVNGIAIIK